MVARLRIRGMTAEDVDAADAIAVAAYGRESRRQDMARLLALQPDGWLLAEVEGVPVGMVGAVNFGSFTYVGQMGVLPAFQRRGIARALMEHLLAWVDERGCLVTLLDASDAGYPLYARLGFVVDDVVHWLERADGGMGDAGTGAEVEGGRVALGERVRPLRCDELAEVVAFDTPRFGADRAAALAAYLESYPARAFGWMDAGGAPGGFLVAQPRMLGPWVAETPEAAEGLLARALTLSFAAAPTVITPGANTAALALLERYGFRARRTLRHMRRGGSPLLARRRFVYGQASFAIG